MSAIGRGVPVWTGLGIVGAGEEGGLDSGGGEKILCGPNRYYIFSPYQGIHPKRASEVINEK